ncbi:DNA primase [Candidatus Nitrospira bockiana]
MGLSLIPEDLINQIRERADLVDIVSGYVTLTRTGQNFKGLCPFHAEKTPSFTVSPSRQIFHCFGCGAGGNVFTFLMKIDGTTFPETVRELGQRLGITVPDMTLQTTGGDGKLRERLERINQAAARIFQQQLWDGVGRDARAYLAERGIGEETVRSFGIGLALPAWDGLLRLLLKSGHALSDIAAAGLAIAKDQSGRRSDDAGAYYDRFRARLMFPITDLRKRVVAFGGRVMGDGEPKYLNSPETPLFSKGRTLYGLDRAREAAGRAGRLVIVEGYFDAIALHQAGITNVAATLGTALTSDHLTTIRRFAGKVVLLFDPDPAGVRAALRTLDLFVGTGLGVTVVSLPRGEDPDTFVRKQGVEAFRRLEETAPSLLDFAVNQSLERTVSRSMDDRIRSVDEILRILQKSRNRIEKEECTRRVAEGLGISQQRLIERYPELLDNESRPGRRPVAPTPASPRRQVVEWDVAYLLLHGHLTRTQVQKLHPEGFTDAACRRIVEIALRHLDRDGRPSIQSILDEGLADPECSAAVTELSAAERHFDDVGAHADGCLEALARRHREHELRELIVRLRAAEQAGRQEEARLLNAQVNALRLDKTGGLPVRTS